MYILVAVDEDLGENGDVRYILERGQDSQYFSIDRNSGNITNNRALDIEKQQHYEVNEYALFTCTSFTDVCKNVNALA